MCFLREKNNVRVALVSRLLRDHEPIYTVAAKECGDSLKSLGGNPVHGTKGRKVREASSIFGCHAHMLFLKQRKKTDSKKN